jgi:sarcosine oxidase, subunit beta
MEKTYEAVIIGGGIQGLSLAHYLARLGMTEVCVLEMNTLGSGSSGRSAAVIGHAFQSAKCLPLVLLSFEALLRFREELGVDAGYEPIGCLLLAGSQDVAELCRRCDLLQSWGVGSELIGPHDIDRLVPGLDLDGIEVGLYNPSEGCIDPHSIMMAYAQYARRLGVQLVEGVEATGLRVVGGRVAGVHTTTLGTINAPCVVNASGFRARRVAAWAAMDLPITNLKRHIFVTGAAPGYETTIPFTYEMGPPWYIRREGPGLLIGMGATPCDEEDPQVDWAFLETVIEQSLRRAPLLAEAGVKTGWAGLRSVTPDDDPILGEAAHLQGFVNDCGWGGHGVMHAPAAGLALAELIVYGQARSVDISHFGAERFAAGGSDKLGP